MKDKIYSLAHPLTSDIFYVGRTILALNVRLGNHMTVKEKQNQKLGIYIDELRSGSIRFKGGQSKNY